MAAVSADMDAAIPSYTPDDGRSWWAKTKDGERPRRPTAVLPRALPDDHGDLLADDRFLRIGRLTDDGHAAGEAHLGRERHRGAGEAARRRRRASPTCRGTRTAASAATRTAAARSPSASRSPAPTQRSGQLRVVAGLAPGARSSPPSSAARLDLPQVDLPTPTGDITVHLSCTLHMSQAPVDRERRVMYTGFRLPEDTSRSSNASANEAKLKPHPRGRLQDGVPSARRLSATPAATGRADRRAARSPR